MARRCTGRAGRTLTFWLLLAKAERACCACADKSPEKSAAAQNFTTCPSQVPQKFPIFNFSAALAHLYSTLGLDSDSTRSTFVYIRPHPRAPLPYLVPSYPPKMSLLRVPHTLARRTARALSSVAYAYNPAAAPHVIAPTTIAGPSSPPPPGFVAIKWLAAGVDQSDLHPSPAATSSAAVAGTEGVGIVTAVGSGVTVMDAGDHVVPIKVSLSYSSFASKKQSVDPTFQRT